MDREAKTLLLHCTTLLDTYNADFEEIEEHTTNYLNQKQASITILLLNIGSNTCRVKNVCSSFVSGD